ncbi:hypothetical protein [Streptomyces chartreusis]|uniref:hypothetical protein n=1 Tax=Streptomyces chartreusis TaxID=1969 RepID=UPI0038268749
MSNIPQLAAMETSKKEADLTTTGDIMTSAHSSRQRPAHARRLPRRLGRAALFGLVRGAAYGCGTGLAALLAWWIQTRG